MLSAASRPSRIAQTTKDAPRTISPAAYTPGIDVECVLKSVLIVPQRVISSSGVSHSFGKSSGLNPKAFITRSASSV